MLKVSAPTPAILWDPSKTLSSGQEPQPRVTPSWAYWKKMLLTVSQKQPPQDLWFGGGSHLLEMWKLCTFVHMIKTLL